MDEWQTEALANQRKMTEYLSVLSGEEAIERAKTVVIQQAMMVHAIGQLHEQIAMATEQIKEANEKWRGIFVSLMKIPIAVVIASAASWAFVEKQIGENSWLIILGVAVFPWLGDSITAIAGIIRGRSNGEKKP